MKNISSSKHQIKSFNYKFKYPILPDKIYQNWRNGDDLVAEITIVLEDPGSVLSTHMVAHNPRKLQLQVI